VPVYRYEPDDEKPPSGARLVQTKSRDSHLRQICAEPQVVVGGTTNAIGKLATKAWKDGTPPWDLLIVDEASQMSLPEFLTAGVGLKSDGRIIVVGDHRQMPPIIKADWEEGDSVVVDPYAAYRSVFDTIRFSPQPKVEIKFSESFRIHRDVAEYLRREVYQFDRIDFFSDKEPAFTASSDVSFAQAVLQSPQPLILITHDERDSQQRNDLEQTLTETILGAIHRLDERPNLGVVVPHRAQRASLRKRLLELTGDEDLADSVDTIERFQGNERDIIVYSATESDPAYLRDTGTFLFAPRRLTVAISRATHKLIVIASESVFDYLPTDEESLENSAIWRNLRAYACPDIAWQGIVDGHHVTVRRSVALERPGQIARR
jgi:superfamily I DNA and/or RNA helicase